MGFRQIDIYLADDRADLPDAEDLKENFQVIDQRTLRDAEGNLILRLLLDAQNTEAVLDHIVDAIEVVEDYRIILSQVTATLPRPDDDDEAENDGEGDDSDRSSPDDKPTDDDDSDDDDSSSTTTSRISREEVYEEVKDSISVSSVHYTLVLLSTVVAATGMLRDSTAVVIGAMVIAPLIGPNIALALGTTLADFSLLRRALRVNFTGLALVLVVALIVGFFFDVDVSVYEIASRTVINTGDATLALAAGAAGVLSVTRGVSTALIGVMVAVALLPPLTATGMLLGTGNFDLAYGAGLLTITNIVAINLAGVLTFLIQGIRPTTWWEAKKARRATIISIIMWVSILAILLATIIFAAPQGVTPK